MRKFYYFSLVGVGVTTVVCAIGLEAWACYKLDNEVKKTNEGIGKLEEVIKKTTKNGESHYIFDAKKPIRYDEK